MLSTFQFVSLSITNYNWRNKVECKILVVLMQENHLVTQKCFDTFCKASGRITLNDINKTLL